MKVIKSIAGANRFTCCESIPLNCKIFLLPDLYRFIVLCLIERIIIPAYKAYSVQHLST